MTPWCGTAYSGGGQFPSETVYGGRAGAQGARSARFRQMTRIVATRARPRTSVTDSAAMPANPAVGAPTIRGSGRSHLRAVHTLDGLIRRERRLARIDCRWVQPPRRHAKRGADAWRTRAVALYFPSNSWVSIGSDDIERPWGGGPLEGSNAEAVTITTECRPSGLARMQSSSAHRRRLSATACRAG